MDQGWIKLKRVGLNGAGLDKIEEGWIQLSRVGLNGAGLD